MQCLLELQLRNRLHSKQTLRLFLANFFMILNLFEIKNFSCVLGYNFILLEYMTNKIIINDFQEDVPSWQSLTIALMKDNKSCFWSFLMKLVGTVVFPCAILRHENIQGQVIKFSINVIQTSFWIYNFPFYSSCFPKTYFFSFSLS